MVKRFRQEKAVWLSYGTFLLQQGQSDAASALLQRAIKSLPNKDSKAPVITFRTHTHLLGAPYLNTFPIRPLAPIGHWVGLI